MYPYYLRKLGEREGGAYSRRGTYLYMALGWALIRESALIREWTLIRGNTVCSKTQGNLGWFGFSIPR